MKLIVLITVMLFALQACSSNGGSSNESSVFSSTSSVTSTSSLASTSSHRSTNNTSVSAEDMTAMFDSVANIDGELYVYQYRDTNDIDYAALIPKYVALQPGEVVQIQQQILKEARLIDGTFFVGGNINIAPAPGLDFDVTNEVKAIVAQTLSVDINNVFTLGTDTGDRVYNYNLANNLEYTYVFNGLTPNQPHPSHMVSKLIT